MDLNLSLPVVTVVIPMSNSEDLLMQAFRAIEEQEMPFVEMILLNDNSNISNTALFEKLRLHYCINTKRSRLLFFKSSSHAFDRSINEALKTAAGEYLTFFIPGDRYAPGRLKEIVTSMIKEGTEWGFSTLSLNNSSIKLHKWYTKNLHTIQSYSSVSSALINQNFILSLGNLIIKRSLFAKVGLAHGLLEMPYDFAFNALIHSEPTFISKNLYRYTCRHEDVDYLMNFDKSPLYKAISALYIQKLSHNENRNVKAPSESTAPIAFAHFRKKLGSSDLKMTQKVWRLFKRVAKKCLIAMKHAR